MATTSWTIEIDWEREGNFNGIYADVTAYVLNANWFIGMRQAYQEMGDDSFLELSLRNDDKRFSPENSSSPLSGFLAAYRPVRVQSNDGTTTRTHFTGWVESIQPTVNQYGERQVKITCAGPMQFYKAQETRLTIQENQSTDAIINALLNEVRLPPALDGMAIIDLPGSIIGSVNIVGDTTINRNLDNGKSTLAYAADNWSQPDADGSRNSFNVYQAIEDIVAAERGRFYFNREGEAIFLNRHHLITDQTLTATLDNGMVEMAYRYAHQGDFANYVTVNCHPRSISVSETELLWQLDQEITLQPGEEREINAPYKDGSNNRIGGRNVALSNVSFAETGNFLAGTVILENAGANQSTVLIRNPHNANDVKLATCELRGQKITDFGTMQAQASDGISMVKYGQRRMALNLPSVDNQEYAQGIADFELLRRKEPTGKVQTVTLRSHGKNQDSIHNLQLARTIGDRIRVIENQAEHDEHYFIIGEAHRLGDAATNYETMGYLESATEGDFFIIGTDEIDSSAVMLPI